MSIPLLDRLLAALARRWAGPCGYREVLIVAGPLMLSTGAFTIQHFVDRMFLTWYAPEAVAASMSGGMMFWTVSALFSGLVRYANVFVAQYYGARQDEQVGPVLWQSGYLAIVGGLLIMLCIPLAAPFFRWVGHEPAICEAETTYFVILCYGAIPGLIMGSLDSFYTGLGRTWPLLWVTLFATAINLVGDYALIFGHWGCPRLGIAGAAWATVVSQCGAMVLLGIMVGQRRHDQRFHLWRGWRFQRELCWRLLRFGTPSGAQFLVDIAGFSVFILLVGGLGTTALTATTLAFNVNMLAFMPMIGTGIAVSILVGNRLGANQPELAERATYSGFQIAATYMAVVGLTYVLMPELYLAPFASKADPNTFPEVQRQTIILLRFVALYCLFDGANIIFSSAVKGAGDTRFVMYALAVTSTCGLVLPSWIGIKLCGGGLLTAWYIITAYICLLAALYYWRFKGGKWKHMRVTGDAPPPPA